MACHHMLPKHKYILFLHLKSNHTEKKIVQYVWSSFEVIAAWIFGN